MSVAGLTLQRWRSGFAESVWADRLVDALPLVPVIVSVIFMAIVLLPEVTVPVPSLNDDAAHYSLILNASRAIDAGLNPIDHWAPDLEIGYPQFAYYQHLPALFVVALNRLVLRSVSLLTLFNLTRWALMAGFPITVYWSLRKLGFSKPAAAAAATFSPLFSAGNKFGIEYDSYVWRGYGMYTQLWAMHLSFLSLAVVNRTLNDGKGYLASVLVLSALVLSHVIYAFVIAVTLPVLMLSGVTRSNWRQRVMRLMLAGAPVMIVTSYFWLPLIINGAYHDVSPYMEEWKYNSFGARTILPWLVKGQLMDVDRWPVITAFAGVGVLIALWTRTRLAMFALAMFTMWLLIYFGKPTWGSLSYPFSWDGKLWMHRYIGPVQMGAVLLIGVAAGWLWLRLDGFKRLRAPWPSIIFVALILVVALPAFGERWTYLDWNRKDLEQTQTALQSDGDAYAIIATLKQLPPGRVYAGLRDEYGDLMKVLWLRFPDLLTFNQIEVAGPPYQSLSINSDVIWHFQYTNASDYDVFNARYVVASSQQQMPSFLTPIMKTDLYTLYLAPTSGYFGLATTPVGYEGPQSQLHVAIRTWFLSPLPGEGVYPAMAMPGTPHDPNVSYAPMVQAQSNLGSLESDAKPQGSIGDENDGLGRYEATIQVDSPTTVFLKATYHPDWHAYVDGREVKPFMVTPSYPAITLQPGSHDVLFVYKSPTMRTVLLFLGLFTLGLVAACEIKRDWLGGMWRSRLETWRAHRKKNEPEAEA
ncbi:MAG TPA: hypothetical protein VFY10_05615 [Dehalococcoidia bacterium]|nr:hypothetical protein [Dehalococcoidia bacterium]